MKLTAFQKILWALAAIATLAFAGVKFIEMRNTQSADLQDPAFRASFELTDHMGMVRTQNDFNDKWMLVFFGFTNCPDVCPTTLSEVAVVMDALGRKADRVQPIFITIDPERDTPAKLAEFVPLFDAGIIGLTGTPGQIEKTSKTFPIFYERIEDAAAPGGYTMGHTSHLFLFDPNGGFADSWPYGTRAEEILADLKERL